MQELDRYIIGQEEAKRAVAIALRNRYRRAKLPPELREEVMPKNILMIGPTGVGKTEIARRLARFANAPFVKVEATKFTEVGYVDGMWSRQCGNWWMLPSAWSRKRRCEMWRTKRKGWQKIGSLICLSHPEASRRL